MTRNVGVLALQGDFSKHREAVNKIGHQTILVRNVSDLENCDSLIIPGGESTTFMNLIERQGLRNPILEFAKNRPIMGTCAGLIILASEAAGLPFKPFGLIDVKVGRNAYGRQINSFIDQVELEFDQTKPRFEGVFIRAPKIVSINQSVNILARYEQDIVMAANDRVMVATFHPELTDDTRIHEYFLLKF